MPTSVFPFLDGRQAILCGSKSESHFSGVWLRLHTFFISEERKRMKKIIALLLALSMLFALTACGGDDKNTPTGESTGETTSTTESTNDATDGTQSTTEDTKGEETTENTENDNTTSTNGNDKWGSVGMTDAFVDNRQPGVEDSFVATPPKYTKDEFVAKVMAYINNNAPTESYLYGEADHIQIGRAHV